MIVHNFKTAFRYLIQKRFFTIVQMMIIAIGILFILPISFWIQHELSFDAFHKNKNQIFRSIYTFQFTDELVQTPLTPPALGPALCANFPQVQDYARVAYVGQKTIQVENQTIISNKIIKTDHAFFDIFSFRLQQGELKTALAKPNSVIISASLANKLYAHQEPLHQLLEIQDIGQFEISGIIEDCPMQSHIQYEVLLPFDATDSQENAWFPYAHHTFLKIDNDNVDELLSSINTFVQSQPNPGKVELHLQPLSKIYLFSDFQRDIQLGSIHNIYLLAGLLFLIIMVIILNSINLITANAIARKDILHIRKILGASKNAIFHQALAESLLEILSAFVCGILMLVLFLPFINTLIGKNFSIGLLFSSFTVNVILFGFLFSLIGIHVLQYLVYFSSRSKNKSFKHTAIAHHLLIFGQFLGSIILIASALVIFNQVHYLKNKPLGYDKENMLIVPLDNKAAPMAETLRQEFSTQAVVLNVCAASDIPISNSIAYFNVHWEGKSPDDKTKVNEITVNRNFTRTLDLKMLKGNDFSNHSEKQHPYLINNTLAKKIGMTDIIGKPFNDGTIIGVFEDFNYHSLYENMEPLFLKLSENNFHYLYIKMAASATQETITGLQQKWQRVVPNAPFEFSFLDKKIDQLYHKENQTQKLVLLFTVTALLISCFGLVGIVQFELDRRTKEIGVRKIIGAQSTEILRTLLAQFAIWILYANIAAIPIACFLMHKWLQNFAYKIDLTIWPFLLAGVVALAIALLTISWQTIRAATANPVEALRYE